MKTFSQVYAVLRRKNAGQYALLAGCNFFSVLLITAYICMMRSPTILAILPEGGDSRKQVMMIFVLAVIGCAVFTTYAAELFFRQKSRETGVFLALGVSRKQLKSELRKDLSILSLCSCVAGAVLGAPLAWAIRRRHPPDGKWCNGVCIHQPHARSRLERRNRNHRHAWHTAHCKRWCKEPSEHY